MEDTHKPDHTPRTSSSRRKPVIAIAGLAIETSTFSPARTHASAFRPARGPDIITRYPFLHPDRPLGQAALWRGALVGHALPGGIVTRAAYEQLAEEIVQRLRDIVAAATATATADTQNEQDGQEDKQDEQQEDRQNEEDVTRKAGLDGLWFDIHGAMCVEGLDDAEVDLLRRVRAVVGADVLVSASMDLHGNVSRELVRMCDLMTCYRMAPHEDDMDTKERACRNLVDLLAQRPGPDPYLDGEQQQQRQQQQQHKQRWERPLKAWIPIPILLPGEQTSTRDQPAKRIYAAVPDVEAQQGVLDAAVWVGYAWADEPRNRAAVVVTGWDPAAVSRGAERLAHLFWDARAEFRFVAPTGSLAECLDAAVRSPPEDRPFFISDSGDNPTAGGAGDVTWSLARILERPEFQRSPSSPSSSDDNSNDDDKPTLIYASIPGPAAVDACLAAGIGATVTVTAGAEIDAVHAPPLTMTGRVRAIKHGDRDAAVEVVLQVGSALVILTRLRKPYHREADFADLGLRPREADVVVVKIGYLEPQLYDMARGWMLALTPGGVDQDIARLGHRRIERPMWPFDREFERPPDLSTVWVAGSNE